MNIAVGIDLIEIDRVERVLARHPKRFLERHFTDRERDECAGDPARLAARWAAKEAAAKALGTGIGPIRWRDVEVRTLPSGAPQLWLHGAAARVAARGRLASWTVSLSHSREHATAVVVAAADPPANPATHPPANPATHPPANPATDPA